MNVELLKNESETALLQPVDSVVWAQQRGLLLRHACALVKCFMKLVLPESFEAQNFFLFFFCFQRI